MPSRLLKVWHQHLLLSNGPPGPPPTSSVPISGREHGRFLPGGGLGLSFFDLYDFNVHHAFFGAVSDIERHVGW